VRHLGYLGLNLGQAKFLQRILALTRPTQYSILCTGVKTGRETPSWIRASLIRKKNPIVLFERHCHGTEKSEAI
jgi:hypothetical protein